MKHVDRFLKYGVLPYSGGGKDQPYLFWQIVKVIETLREKEQQTIRNLAKEKIEK